jgi:predicted hydrolase (HD superfamily)
MDNAIVSLIEGAPWAAALILTIYLFLRAEQMREERRDANAKEKAQEDRAHDLALYHMRDNHISVIVAKMEAVYQLIAKSLDEHEKADAERYKKIGITQDLLRIASQDAAKRKKEREE